MKVTNPQTRSIIATMVDNTRDVTTYEVPAGESIETDDYVVASTLIEHGCTAEPVEIQAARAAWADRNRAANSRTASAVASEGKILERQQRTVSVADGTVDGDPAQLRGESLASAVKAANDAGAEIATSGTADERRDALAAWQSRPADGGDYVLDDEGDPVLDTEGQPYRLDDVERGEDGEPVLDGDGKPTRVS